MDEEETGLPLDVLNIIFSDLDASSLLHSLCVCKKWQSCITLVTEQSLKETGFSSDALPLSLFSGINPLAFLKYLETVRNAEWMWFTSGPKKSDPWSVRCGYCYHSVVVPNMIMPSTGPTQGKHYFEIKVHHIAAPGRFFVGIVSSRSACHYTCSDSKWKRVGWLPGRGLLSSRHTDNVTHSIGTLPQDGDVIGCFLDMNQWTLAIYLNQELLGIIPDIPKKRMYWPAVELHGHDAMVLWPAGVQNAYPRLANDPDDGEISTRGAPLEEEPELSGEEDFSGDSGLEGDDGTEESDMGDLWG